MSIIAEPAFRGGRLRKAVKTIVLNGSNETKNQEIFKFTGTVGIRLLFGKVASLIGSNMSSVGFVVSSTGGYNSLTPANITISNFVVGSLLSMTTAGITGVSVSSSPNGFSTAGSHDYRVGKVAVQQPDTDSYISIRYTTTSTPLTGTIDFEIWWEPLSEGATLIAA